MEERKRVVTVLEGFVSSTKADKTVTVVVERSVQHPIYKKTVRLKKKYLAHDEENRCHIGDKVKIQMVRPISKRKRWLVVDIQTIASGEEVNV
jgi:small subunit ribosomal protein S17